MSITTNLPALIAQRHLAQASEALTRDVQRLSSGQRINSAADDASGLTISEGMQARVRGYAQGSRNAQDAISMVQTAEGALNEDHGILQRMRVLALQAANGTLSAEDRAAVNAELQQLKDEINSIAQRTNFNGRQLLMGPSSSGASAGGVVQDTSYPNSLLPGMALNGQGGIPGGTATVTKIDVSGAQPGDTFVFRPYGNPGDPTYTLESNGTRLAELVYGGGTLTTSAEFALPPELSVRVTAGTGGKTFSSLVADLTSPGNNTIHVTAAPAPSADNGVVFQVGPEASDRISVPLDRVDVSQASLASLDTALQAFDANQTADAAQLIVAGVDDAIASVSASRARFGAYQNRFEHILAANSVAQENLSAADSRIKDADMAQTSVSFTRDQILQQAGLSVLAQANQSPRGVLDLLARLG